MVTLTLHLKEDVAEEVIAGLPEGLKDTVAFGGLRSIVVMRNKADPTHIEIVEHWDTLEAHTAYMAWRTESGALDYMNSVVETPPSIDAWDLLVQH